MGRKVTRRVCTSMGYGNEERAIGRGGAIWIKPYGDCNKMVEVCSLLCGV